MTWYLWLVVILIADLLVALTLAKLIASASAPTSHVEALMGRAIDHIERVH